MMAPTRADGIALTTSPLIVACRLMLCTSTIGDSPVTMIVSSSDPRRRSALMLAVS